jgi:thiopeptide-type bacteriocin biosynthesis protein
MNYKLLPELVLRTPYFPYKSDFSKESLISFFKQKKPKEALFIASPTLYYDFNKYLDNTLIKKKESKLFNSLLKYALRMHTRCTPFGLFSSCGVLKYSGQNKIIIDTKKYHRYTRLDMNFSCALAQELSKLDFIKQRLKYYPNSTLYNVFDKLRYIESTNLQTLRIFQLISIDHSNYLEAIIKTSKSGATINEIIELLTKNNVSSEEAESFVSELINSQILISELEPKMTGKELLDQIINNLLHIQANQPNRKITQIIEKLKQIQQTLKKIDLNFGNQIKVYEKLALDLEQFNIKFELGKLFQTDLYIDFEYENENSRLNFDENILSAVKFLNRINFYYENEYLNTFREKFSNRYEEKAVQLSEALDAESGIGYGSNNNFTSDINPLVDNLFLQSNHKNFKEIQHYTIHSLLFKKLKIVLKENLYTLQLKIEEFEHFKENWENLPDSMSVLFNHIEKKGDSDIIYLKGASGSSAINLLGRFGTDNKKLKTLIDDIADYERKCNPNKIIASIVHLPENRVGNILIRPIIRKFEIPYLSNSSVKQQQQLDINDLYVKVRNDEIILFSKKLNKEVIPGIDNSHNYSFDTLPIYHFLCDLQNQNKRNTLTFNWGHLSAEFSFLPRVEIDGVIIHLATWIFKVGEITSEINDLGLFHEWRKLWKIPNLILFCEGDNELLINLDNDLSLKMFIHEIKNKKRIILKEFLFDQKNAIIKNKKKQVYTNEFIATLVKEKKSIVSRNNNKINSTKIARTFTIGSEWIYYKIYCGIKTADRILKELIKPLADQFIEKGLIDQWFFIRYSDPDLHIRIRFHVTHNDNLLDVIQEMQKSIVIFQNSGLIWKIQTDSYQREIERYGVNTMLLSEKLFFIESKFIVDSIFILDNLDNENYRWLLSMKAIDGILDSFFSTINQKIILIEKLKNGFAQEFNINKTTKVQLDLKYRENKKIIELFLQEQDQYYSLFSDLLINKSIESVPIINEILALQNRNLLTISVDNLIASYVHMFVNRLFRNKQRVQEMVIYDFIWRYYKSVIARNK